MVPKYFILYYYRFQRQKLLFLLFQLLTGIAFFGIQFIKPIEHAATVEFHCNDGVSDLRYCPPNGTDIDTCITDDLTRERSNQTINDFMTCLVSIYINGLIIHF